MHLVPMASHLFCPYYTRDSGNFPLNALAGERAFFNYKSVQRLILFLTQDQGRLWDIKQDANGNVSITLHGNSYYSVGTDDGGGTCGGVMTLSTDPPVPWRLIPADKLGDKKFF